VEIGEIIFKYKNIRKHFEISNCLINKNMPAYSKEKQEEQIARIRQILVLKPSSSVMTVKELLAEQGEKLDRRYITKLKKKIEKERANRYNARTKEMVLSQFEDLVNVMSDVLKKIALSKTDSTQLDKTTAISQLIKQNKLVIEMMMDMGLLERYIGKMTHDVETSEILKLIEDAKHNNKDDKEKENRDSAKINK